MEPGYKAAAHPEGTNGKKQVQRYEPKKKVKHPAAAILRNSIQISRSERRIGTVPEMKIGLLASEIRDLRSMRKTLVDGLNKAKDEPTKLSYAKIILDNHEETRKVIDAIPDFEIDPKPKKQPVAKSKDGAMPVAQPGRLIDIA